MNYRRWARCRRHRLGQRGSLQRRRRRTLLGARRLCQYQHRKRFKEVTEAMEVSRIPDDWRQGLSRGGAYHPPIPPNVSIAENDPPEHYNLDGVFRFLTD